MLRKNLLIRLAIRNGNMAELVKGLVETVPANANLCFNELSI